MPVRRPANPPATASLSDEQAAQRCPSVRDHVGTAAEGESNRRRLLGRVRARHHPGGGPVPMLPPVPVSRKRKKKTSGSSGRPSGRTRSPMSQPGSDVAAPARDDRELARAFQGLAAYRDQVHRQRESRAATMATDLIADLARAVVDQPDIVVSDAVCERMGALLAEDAGSPLDVRVSPDHLAEATLAAAEASVEAALTGDHRTARRLARAVACAHRTDGRAAVPVPRRHRRDDHSAAGPAYRTGLTYHPERPRGDRAGAVDLGPVRQPLRRHRLDHDRRGACALVSVGYRRLRA